MQAARYLTGQKDRLDTADRGLAYGDGVFETMALRAGDIRFLELHLDRLSAGCERLEIPLPSLDELRSRLLAEIGGSTDGTVKLIVTRGRGPRGYAPPLQPVPTVIISVHPRSASPATRAEGIDVVTLNMRLGENAKLAGIKHLCRLEQVMAQLELRHHDAQEGLLRSMSGTVVGGTSSNVFGVFGKRLATPKITVAGIRGVMRRAVIEACGEVGFELAETELSLPQIYMADEIFLTNALIGIQPVERLDGRRFPEHSAARDLQRLLGLEAHG